MCFKAIAARPVSATACGKVVHEADSANVWCPLFFCECVQYGMCSMSSEEEDYLKKGKKRRLRVIPTSDAAVSVFTAGLTQTETLRSNQLLIVPLFLSESASHRSAT